MTDTIETTGSTVPQPHHAVETAFLPPEAVLFDDRHGEIHHLNPSASAVWLLLDGELSVDEVAGELSEIFPVPFDQLRGDVVAAVDDFRARGLLDGTPAADVSTALGDPEGRSDVDVRRLEVAPRPPDT